MFIGDVKALKKVLFQSFNVDLDGALLSQKPTKVIHKNTIVSNKRKCNNTAKEQ